MGLFFWVGDGEPGVTGMRVGLLGKPEKRTLARLFVRCFFFMFFSMVSSMPDIRLGAAFPSM